MYIYNFVWANYSARQLIAFEIWHIALGKNTLQAIRTFDMDIGVRVITNEFIRYISKNYNLIKSKN